jgi:hypothetical protein
MRVRTLTGAILVIVTLPALGLSDTLKWSDCVPTEAERVVTLEIVDAGRVVSGWRFPVKLWRQSDLVQRARAKPVERWFRAPHLARGPAGGRIFSYTWLGGVDPDVAFLSYEWYTGSPASGANRLAKEVVAIKLHEPFSRPCGPRMTLRAAYADVKRPKASELVLPGTILGGWRTTRCS